MTAEATGARTTVSLGRASASDLFGPVTVANNAPSSFPLGRATVTWTATDANSNSATAAQAVTVRDTTPPVVSAPSDASFEATAPLTPVSASRYGTASASDLVDSSPTVTSNAPLSFPVGRTTITWTATDDANNSATATHVVTIQDTTPPSITAPPDVAAEATGALTSVSLGLATATDVADSSVDVSADNLGPFRTGNTAVTWTATDDSGNSATAVQTVTVRDTSGPVITAPSDITAEATGTLTSVSLGLPQATDAADGNLTASHDAPSNAAGLPVFPLGATVVTWTATDTAGNTGSDTQTVTVQDTTPPLIRVLGPHGAQTAVPLTRVDSFAQYQVTDLFGVKEVGITPEVVPLGATVVTFSATDTHGNAASTPISLTLSKTRTDRYAPAFPAPPDISVRSSSATTVEYGQLLVWDDYDPSPSLTCNPSSGSLFQPGVTQVRCTVSDSTGNQRHRSFNVLVDSTAISLIHESRFASSLGSITQKETDWSQNGRVCSGAGVSTSSATPVYSLSHSSESGGTAHLQYSDECWSGHSGIVGSFSMPGTAASTLVVEFDYRGLADLLGYRHINHVNNLRFAISDSDGRVLDVGKPLNGREQPYLDDSGWRHVTAVLPQTSPASCPCQLYAYTGDYWSAVWKKQLYFDNLTAYAVAGASPGAGAPQEYEAPPPPNLLTVDELVSMQDYADSRVVIVEKRAYDDSVVVSWDHERWARDYKAVIYPAGDRSAKFADIVSGADSYRFVNLEPDTEYVVSVGERGDDSTQASVVIRTPESGTHPFDPDLDLSVRQDGNTAHVSWTDSNGEGNDRYRVERAVGGGPFVEIERQPGSKTEATDTMAQEWSGEQISYRVFEWFGKQKLYSDAVSFVAS